MKELKLITTTLCLVFTAFCSYAQQLKDGVPVQLNGMEVTFRVVNKETIKIKDVDYDRYKVIGSVKNTSGKGISVRMKTFPDLSVIGVAKLVEMNCINATGDRLTSKRMTMSMTPHNVNVTYFTRDKDNKLVSQNMVVIAGYYLDEGQTVEDDAIFIVPAGQDPQVTARYLK